MLLNNKNYKKKILYILNLFSILCILTISSTPENLFKYNFIENKFYENIHFIKSIIPIIIFFILLLLIIKKFINFSLIKTGIILNLFFFLAVLQSIGTVTSEENYFKNLYYIIPMINIFLISLFFFKKVNKKLIINFLYSNIIVFFIIFLYFFFFYLKNYFLFDNNLYSIWGTIKNNENVPRPTGMSRIIFIFSAFFLCNYLVTKKKILTLIFFNYLIYAYQSRTVILGLILVTLILILKKTKKSIKEISKYVLLLIILPLIISLSIDSLKRKILFNEALLRDQIIYNRIFDPEIIKNNISSNRFNDWKNILKEYEKKKIFGYGVHGDRLLINQTASNGFLYSMVSGGYLAALIYFVICIYSIFLVCINLLNKKIDLYIWFSSSLILFFIIRSIFENSFTIISFDFIIFYFAVFHLERVFFYNSKNKSKFFKILYIKSNIKNLNLRISK